jgi:hypothetical protein
MTSRKFIALFPILMLSLGAALAEEPAAESKQESGQRDVLQLDASEVTGNQELPKVLYIVPWKTAGMGELAGKPANTLLDEVLSPIDREVFKRQVRYYYQLSAADKKAAENR